MRFLLPGSVHSASAPVPNSNIAVLSHLLPSSMSFAPKTTDTTGGALVSHLLPSSILSASAAVHCRRGSASSLLPDSMQSGLSLIVDPLRAAGGALACCLQQQHPVSSMCINQRPP